MTSASQFNPKSRNFRRIMLGLTLVLVAFIGFRIWQQLSSSNKAKIAPATVMQLKKTELVVVEPNIFEKILPLSGALTPYTQAAVSARASGEVANVNVREGQAVRQGEVLAKLVDTTYRAQYQQAVSNVASAKSALQLAQQDYNNNVELVKDGFISKFALQKIQVSLSNASSQLRNAEEAQIIAKRALDEATIVAPVSGVISVSKINAGDTVAIGTPLFNIVDISKFELVAPMSTEQIGALQEGQLAKLTSAGVSQPFTGRIDRINPEAQNGSRSYSVYIVVQNSSGQLKAGMFAQGNIVLTAQGGVLSVPATAIHTMGERNFVYLIRNGKLAEQDVVIGDRTSDAIDAPVEIKSGIVAGDQVIRLDLGELKAGIAVQVLGEKETAKTTPAVPAVKTAPLTEK